MTETQARKIAEAIYRRDRQMFSNGPSNTVALDSWANLVIDEWVKIILENCKD